jgi:hypothetical protein
MVSIAGVFCFVHRLTCSVSGSCGGFFSVMVPSPLPGALFQRFPRSVRELLFAYSESVDLVAWCVALSITRAAVHRCRARIWLGTVLPTNSSSKAFVFGTSPLTSTLCLLYCSLLPIPLPPPTPHP